MKWIPLEEECPPMDTLVLVCNQYRPPNYKIYIAYQGKWCTDKQPFILEDGTPLSDVTHWMYLPGRP